MKENLCGNWGQSKYENSNKRPRCGNTNSVVCTVISINILYSKIIINKLSCFEYYDSDKTAIACKQQLLVCTFNFNFIFRWILLNRSRGSAVIVLKVACLKYINSVTLKINHSQTKYCHKWFIISSLQAFNSNSFITKISLLLVCNDTSFILQVLFSLF